jgi:hypothetical protein
MSSPSSQTAVLQFEINLERLRSYPNGKWVGAFGTVKELIDMAQQDTITNGGTFVLVVTPETITVVQRPDAEPTL